MGFLYEIKERNQKQFACITGYEGEVSFLHVPETVEGVPVMEVSAHAFSGRQDLEEVDCPATVRKLGAFCFYDCENLRRITVYDSVEDYYDGVIRSCRRLQEIVVFIRRGSFRVVKEMMEDNREVLHFRLVFPSADGTLVQNRENIVRLTIPAYHDEDREDTMARAIHPKIVGAGYAYRQTVSRTEIQYGEYDSLFSKAVTDDTKVAAQIALDRLLYPRELQASAREQYETFLHVHAGKILQDLIADGDVESLREMLQLVTIDAPDVDEGLRLAAEKGQAEMAALLMEYSRTHRKPAAGQVFQL